MHRDISRLGIVLGFRCNFSCAHCSVSGLHRKKLSQREVAGLAQVINGSGIKSLLFVGGEPSLYIPETNDILGRLQNLPKIKIKITTNGHFAKSKAAALATLAKYRKLDYIQLSFDTFHAKYLPKRNIENLYLASKEMRKGFGVLFAMQSPMDLALLCTLRKVGDFPIAIQKVLPVGSAKTNKLSFPFPSFNRRVLNKRCENQGKAAYVCGRGFSVCCANLTFGPRYKKFAHASLSEHTASPFYKLISSCSFGEIMNKFGLSNFELKPEHSSRCVLCEELFRQRPDFERYAGRASI